MFNGTICYLVNQYPKVSHTFIRREILGIEKAGAKILRVTIRRPSEALTSEEDIQELACTHALLENKSAIIRQTFRLILSSPLLFAKALLYALSIAGRSRIKGFIYFAEAAYLHAYLKQNQVDHVHAHFGTNTTTVAAICRKLGGPPFSFTVHGPDEFDDPNGYCLQQKIAASKFTVAITHFCSAQLMRWARFEDWPKIKIVRCTVDGKIYDDCIMPISSSNQLLHIGRLSQQKGQMFMLQALAYLKREHGVDVKLNIVGDGEFRAPLTDFINKNDLANNVKILGLKSSDEIAKLLDESSCLILPSFAEGLPVVIMESFARARPVLTTRIAGVPELVDSSCGFLVNAGDVNNLSDTILKLINEPVQSLIAMGTEGRQRIETIHHPDIQSTRLLEYISE